MFEYLFKYPATVWQNAKLVFESRWPVEVLIALFAVGTVVLLVILFRQSIKASRKSVLAILQISLLLLGLTMLWRPALLTEQMVPGENTVSFLVDTSQSMSTQDVNGESRIRAAQSLLLNKNLNNSDWFESSFYSLSQNLSVLDPVDALTANDNQTALIDGVSNVLEGVGDSTLAAVVLLSDGANNVGSIDSDWWQQVKASGVPVHTVGFGQPVGQNDLELRDVFIDDIANVNSVMSARLHITHNGISAARIRVHQGSQLLLAQNIQLDLSLAESVHRIELNSGVEGVRELRFSLEALDDSAQPFAEENTANNVQTRVQHVMNKPKRILYVEGEPRWEYKFIRRALSEQGSVELVSLLRTSANKFFRQGVQNASELSEGFPLERDSLFAYDAIIIGSLDAAELSVEQQVNLRDFVSIRGGSLLMLAGRKGLSDGGWGRSVVASTLPSLLSPRADGSTYIRNRASVSITLQGERTPWLNLAEQADENKLAWLSLPELADWQSVGEVKPGASTLLELQTPRGREPLLLWPRYGQGSSAILASSGTWRWQMRMPSENLWHQQFWQQLLSQLVNTALPRVSIEIENQVVRDQNEINVTVNAREANFEPVLGGELQAVLVSPSGEQSSVSLSADVNTLGRFVASVATPEDGPYSIQLYAQPRGEAMADVQSFSAVRYFMKESGTAETFASSQQQGFLQRLASETGGQYLDASGLEADQLIDVLSLQNAGITREQYLPVWNMPLLFILLILGKLLEWWLRLRWKRL